MKYSRLEELEEYNTISPFRRGLLSSGITLSKLFGAATLVTLGLAIVGLGLPFFGVFLASFIVVASLTLVENIHQKQLRRDIHIEELTTAIRKTNFPPLMETLLNEIRELN